MSRQLVIALYVAAMVSVIIGVDVAFFGRPILGKTGSEYRHCLGVRGCLFEILGAVMTPTLSFTPVHLWETLKLKRTIADVPAAARFLLEKWPGGDTPLTEEARGLCLAAMEGRATVDEVREALIEAAKAANVFARGATIKRR